MRREIYGIDKVLIINYRVPFFNPDVIIFLRLKHNTFFQYPFILLIYTKILRK
jgi:hypothetical protein